MDHEEPRECYEMVLAKKARSAKRTSLVRRSNIARISRAFSDGCSWQSDKEVKDGGSIKECEDSSKIQSRSVDCTKGRAL